MNDKLTAEERIEQILLAYSLNIKGFEVALGTTAMTIREAIAALTAREERLKAEAYDRGFKDGRRKNPFMNSSPITSHGKDKA